MRKIIFLLIVILQQAVCVHQSIFDLFHLRFPHKYNDDFETPMEYPSSVNDERALLQVDEPPKPALNPVVRTWPVMRQHAQSNDIQYRGTPSVLYRGIPSNIFPSARPKRPDASNMEKLTYLLNNYNPRSKITREDGHTKRTHRFGFWTNYLARN